MKTRETASVGYHRALAAHRAVAAPCQEDPALAVTVRQEQARRDLTTRVFCDVEQDQEDEAPAWLEDARTQPHWDAEAVRAAAIRRVRVGCDGKAGAVGVPVLRRAG